MLPIDEVNPECEISVVDIEAVGAFVHCSVAPIWSLQKVLNDGTALTKLLRIIKFRNTMFPHLLCANFSSLVKT